MFPIDVPNDIINTVRIMPHDQNTGGFYIALLQKLEDFKTEIFESIPQEVEKKSKIQIEQMTFQAIDEDSEVMTKLKDSYGLESLPKGLLYSTNMKLRNVFYISPCVKRLLDSDKTQELNVFNMGVQVFTKNREKESNGICGYRVMQDALPFISQYITRRKIVCNDLLVLKTLLHTGNIFISNINDPVCTTQLTDLGYYVFSFPEISEEIVILKLSSYKLTSMIPKEHIDSLKIRYNILDN